MSCLSLGHYYSIHTEHGSLQELMNKKSKSHPRCLIIVSCHQSKETVETQREKKKKKKEEEEEKPLLLLTQVFVGAEKFGRGLKKNLSPQQKGDWKDVMLMSLSFAVYVYISQTIVCAYLAWMSMPKQAW